MVRVTRLLAGIILLSGAPAAAQRLSDTVVPEHYALWFAPDLERETFHGRQAIDVVLTESTSTITLHAAEIAFDEVTITSGGVTQAARVTLDPTRETATFTVPQPLAEGRATIRTTYTGVLNDKLRGFYISRANGRKYAVTQLEPTDARRAFPSFDEPAFKATFDISITVADGDTAISNGRVVSDTPGPDPGTHTLTFARTPKMSTYLAAMIVGDFVCKEGSADDTPIRVCATPDKVDLTGFALDAARQQLAFFNDYFAIPYAFGKLDIIAVPDFAAGAMENAGAITFRERLLLVDPRDSSIAARKRVASVISHEIAHQWFGNLVTMKWWDDIWLNEGFATWISSKPLAVWRPEWKVELDDAADTQGALGIDAMRSTRPIRFTVETPAEINEVFDGIAYQKTAAVLRMIEAYVGPDAFRQGIVSYLRRFAYANAAGEDFWNELTRVTGKRVDSILRSFVDRAGAPLISAQTACAGADSTEAGLTVSRFVGAPGATQEASGGWTLPVCVRTPSGTASCEVIDRPRQTVRAAGCERGGGSESEALAVVNADRRGYYFSEYAAGTVRALAAASGGLTPVERLGLVADEWWMVRAGRHDIGVYLDAASALADDPANAVLEAIAGRLNVIGSDILTPSDRAAFEAWVRSRFGPQLTAIGIPGEEGDSDERHSRRATLLALVGVLGNDAAVQSRARELALRYLDGSGALPPTLAQTVLNVAAFGGDAALYDRYRAQLASLSSSPEQFYRLFGALAWFRQPAVIARTHEFALSPAVRTQDTATLLGNLMTRPWSQEITWRFVRDNWTRLVATLGEFQGIPNLVESFGALCSASLAREVRDLVQRSPVASSQRAAAQAIERIDSCVALVARHRQPLSNWLASTRR